MTSPVSVALVVSCLKLSAQELTRRIAAAETAAQVLPQKSLSPEEAPYAPTPGAQILWHSAFPNWFCAQLTMRPLYEVAAWLSDFYAPITGRTLDLFDCGYLADVLRTRLANEPSPLDACRWRRALAWVEQAGMALLAEQAALTPTANATAVPPRSAAAE